MRKILVIPARYASTRLPGKPLLNATGRSLIEHVHELACQAAGFDRVLVATDDERIAAVVEQFGGEVEMTRPDHPSGTDRLAEVASRDPEAEVLLNLQGDEPEMRPEALTALAQRMTRGDIDVATLATPITEPEEFHRSSVVKVVVDASDRALYFSRSPIPHPRDGESLPSAALKHIGVYAFRRAALLEFAQQPPAPLETTERLEQLRLLHHGRSIAVVRVDFDPTGIDTPQDYERFVSRFKTERGEP